MTEIYKEFKAIPAALSDRMQRATDHQGLLEMWSELEKALDQTSDAPLHKALHLVHHSLKKGACDSGVRAIFENPALLEELDALGIPKAFLLQCVMVGALAEQMSQVTRGNWKTGQIEPQTLWLETNGWSWANEELKKCLLVNKEKETRASEEAKMSEKVKKEALIAELQANLDDPDFKMTPEQKDLLREDFRYKLMHWKAFCDRHMSDKEIWEFHRSERGCQPITPDIYADFVKLCKNNPEIDTQDFPFEIINPDSGWFYVLTKNKVNSLNSFLQAAVSNMNSWFVL